MIKNFNNQGFLKHLLIFTIISLVGMDVFATDKVEVITKRFGSSVYTTDMTPFNISIMNGSIVKSFRVPKAYIEKDHTWWGIRLVKFFEIRAIVPDMTPYAFSKIYDSKNKFNSVYITVKHSRVSQKNSEASYKRISSYERIGELAGLEAYRKDRKGSCYRRDLVENSTTADPLFKDLIPDNRGKGYYCWPYGDEIYVTKPKVGSRYISIKCPPLNGMNKQIRCRARTSFNGWLIDYVFYSQDRSNWKYYDDKVQSLLNSLEV